MSDKDDLKYEELGFGQFRCEGCGVHGGVDDCKCDKVRKDLDRRLTTITAGVIVSGILILALLCITGKLS